MNIYGYFKWDHHSLINGCEPSVIYKQHGITEKDEVYFITLNSNPFFIVTDKSEEEMILFVASLEEQAIALAKKQATEINASNENPSIEIEGLEEISEEELAETLANNI